MAENTNYGDVTVPSKNFESVHEAVRRLNKGKINATCLFSPAASTQISHIKHSNIGDTTTITLYPITPEAAAVVSKFYELKTDRIQSLAKIVHPVFSPANAALIKFMCVVIG